MLVANLNTVQPDPSYRNSQANDTVTTLRIAQPQTGPVKFVQEYIETSAIAGLATIGGFWTFVNGAFTLLFGTNVLYFLIGEHAFRMHFLKATS